jgi:hypothetical protein
VRLLAGEDALAACLAHVGWRVGSLQPHICRGVRLGCVLSGSRWTLPLCRFLVAARPPLHSPHHMPPRALPCGFAHTLYCLPAWQVLRRRAAHAAGTPHAQAQQQRDRPACGGAAAAAAGAW